MAITPDHDTGRARWNGATPFSVDTGQISFSTASQIRQNGIVAPCDATIVAALMRTLASATGASSQFNIGINGLASGLLTYYGAAQLASTVTDLMAASTWVSSASKKVRRGDFIYFNVKKTTAVGRFAVRLIFMPR
jgi:hypothetical protein